jgi:ELWxxDGT repeat protein
MDINTGADASRTSAPGTAFNGLLYFPATAADSGTELWASDGTEAGTTLLTDLVPGTGSSNPEDLIVVGDQLFFTAEAAATGRELYRTDGTEDEGTELWRTDGTTEGTILTKDLNEGRSGSLFLPPYLHAHNDLLFFAAKGDVVDGFGSTGIEPYVSNGTSEGTFLVSDINDGFSDSRPNNFVSVGEQLFFFADNGTDGQELYVVTTAPAILPVSVDRLQQNFVRCNGQSNGAIDLTVSGGVPPYRIGDQTSEDGEFLIQNLAAGDYTVLIMDARDSPISVFASVPEPTLLRILLNDLTGQNSLEGGSIAVMPAGGIPPYRFAWADTSLTTNIREDLDFGTYYLTVTDDNNCMTQDSFMVDDLTSVTNLSEGEFKVYPTVVTDQLTAEVAGGVGIRKIACYDLAGREVSRMAGAGQQRLTLGSSFLPKAQGTYLIYLTATDGRKGVRRVVIQR